MSIRDAEEKINPVRNREGSQRPSVSNGVKQFVGSEKGKDILIVIIVILVGLMSFWLGRLSIKSSNIGIKTEPENQSANAISAVQISQETSNTSPNTKITQKITSNTGNFIASNKGHKYYPISCSAGRNIAEANKIYFQTAQEAKKAGYTLSASC